MIFAYFCPFFEILANYSVLSVEKGPKGGF
jgi:hypothetical protein